MAVTWQQATETSGAAARADALKVPVS